MIPSSQIAKLNEMERRYKELNGLLSSSSVLRNRELLEKYAREHGKLEETVSLWKKYKGTQKEIEKLEIMFVDEQDRDMRQLAEEERIKLDNNLENLESKLLQSFSIEDAYSQRNVIMEIRAGAGGEEAALFAADLYKMYARFVEKKEWKLERITHHPTDRGGFRELIFAITGKEVFSNLRYESGVHRVQRVPVTESSGRIHTSTVTVAVLPEADEIEVQIKPEDLRIDTFHSRGAGGQHVNVTDSAVRITHRPTGIVVNCQDERSQHQNKIKAMRILRAEFLQRKREEQQKNISLQRKNQIGSGERSERIRTYNFPQGRVTDHRIHLTLHNLDSILDGELDNLIRALEKEMEEERIVGDNR